LQQTSAAADGRVREWPAPAAGIDRHRGYALQWYSLAGLAAGLTAWYAWHLIKLRPSDAHDPRPAARR
jgi:surfeit locus 1 family protein